MNKEIYKKICLVCGNEKIYSDKYKLERAVKDNSCQTCAYKKPQKHRQNLTGNVYGRLTVLSFCEKRGKEQYWNCKCNCGKETVIRHSHLTRQSIRSCGCSHFYLKDKHPHWKGVGEMPGLYFCELKRSAAARNLKLDVTKEQIWELFLKQQKKCALTGIELRFQSRQSLRDGTASMDRIDSTKGYTDDNIQWVHKIINNMKKDLKEQDFVNWCKLVVERKM